MVSLTDLVNYYLILENKKMWKKCNISNKPILDAGSFPTVVYVYDACLCFVTGTYLSTISEQLMVSFYQRSSTIEVTRVSWECGYVEDLNFRRTHAHDLATIDESVTRYG